MTDRLTHRKLSLELWHRRRTIAMKHLQRKFPRGRRYRREMLAWIRSHPSPLTWAERKRNLFAALGIRP